MNILTAIAFTPLAGTLVLFFFPRRSVFAARITALAASGLAATLAAAALFLFSAQDGGFQFAEQFHFIGMKSSFLVASDGLGVLALALVNAIAFLSALFPFDPEDRRKEYYFWLLFSQAMFTGIIVSGDLLSFSGFWFLSVLPVYFLTSLCAERAALRYFLPQFAGAVLMLAAVTAVQLQAGKGGLVIAETASGFKLWAVGFMVLSIIIRIPVFPFNLWMKDFYMQTPGHLSALIAGSSAVTSLYAAQKLLIPIMKSGVAEFAPGVMILAAFSALYAAVMILPQKNLK
ncbi:MAG: proton-conducting transporter membrane subunit, partial [Elusimicrobiaceae bacterium]